jgi:hypothetical protein
MHDYYLEATLLLVHCLLLLNAETVKQAEGLPDAQEGIVLSSLIEEHAPLYIT